MRNKIVNFYIDFRAKFIRLRDSIFGDTNYKKFIIISDSRTGSTLVNNMLNFHPKIIAKGEVFRELNSKSSGQVWKELFSNYPKRIKYVGIKLFYHHPLKGDKGVWDLVERDRSIVIIHLVRKNILRSLVSKKIGLKTKQWTENVNSTETIDAENKKIELSPEECESYFEEIKAYQEKTDSMFSKHKLIPLTYEDLAKDRRKVINGLYRALGLDRFERDSELKKQNPEPLEDLILNYQELKNHFYGSKWEIYFNGEQQ
ncbi:sulfotransferase domain-containing protein [Salinimicrobium gaetbulicola]|uniref:Sulfotransferase domain-containing protein n=1 Tax=Salinimicrobium gaetbulicola TaxID=999702 RepID=A0ABW3IIL5_9FLAO